MTIVMQALREVAQREAMVNQNNDSRCDECFTLSVTEDKKIHTQVDTKSG